MQSVLPRVIDELLANSRCPKSPTEFVDLENQHEFNSIIAKRTIDTKGVSHVAIVVFNSLARPRCEARPLPFRPSAQLSFVFCQIIQLVVDSPNVRVFDSKGKEAEIQFAPVFVDDSVSSTEVRVFVRIHVPALGYTTYFIKRDDKVKPDKSLISTVELRNFAQAKSVNFLGTDVTVNPTTGTNLIKPFYG